MVDYKKLQWNSDESSFKAEATRSIKGCGRHEGCTQKFTLSFALRRGALLLRGHYDEQRLKRKWTNQMCRNYKMVPVGEPKTYSVRWTVEDGADSFQLHPIVEVPPPTLVGSWPKIVP